MAFTSIINWQLALDKYNNKTDELDVLNGEGILFKIAISKNNFEICEALLSFFENKQNPNQQQKDDLKDILEEITSFSDISKEMQEVLEKYLPKEEDSDSEQELEDIIMPTLNAGIITTELTEDSLRKFEAETKEINSTKIIENLLGFDTKEIQHSIEEDTTNINVDLSGDNIQKVH